MNIILVNAIVYLLVLALLYVRQRHLSLVVLVWAAHTASAWMSVFAINRGIYFYGTRDIVYHVPITPYVYAFLVNLIICLPLRKVDVRRIDVSRFDTSAPILQLFMRVCIVLTFSAAMLKIREILVIRSLDFGDIYSDSVSGERTVDYANRLLHTLSNGISNSMIAISPLIFFYLVSRVLHRGGQKWFNYLAIAALLLLSVAQPIIGGSRGAMFFMAFRLLFFYLVVRKHLSVRLRRGVAVIGAATLVGLFSVSQSITADRFYNNQYSATDNIIEYFGEPYLNLGACIWEHVYHHPMGKRYFSTIENNDFRSSQDYWRYSTGADTQLFKTIFGDCYIEFGTMGAILFVLAQVLLWKVLVLRRYTAFSMIALVQSYYHFTLYAMFGYDQYFTDLMFYIMVAASIFVGIVTSPRKHRRMRWRISRSL